MKWEVNIRTFTRTSGVFHLWGLANNIIVQPRGPWARDRGTDPVFSLFTCTDMGVCVCHHRPYPCTTCCRRWRSSSCGSSA